MLLAKEIGKSPKTNGTAAGAPVAVAVAALVVVVAALEGGKNEYWAIGMGAGGVILGSVNAYEGVAAPLPPR